MNLYNQGGGDYGSRVAWEPPDPRPPSGSGWGISLMIWLLAAAVCWLLWDKFAGQSPKPATSNPPGIANLDAPSNSSANIFPDKPATPTKESSGTPVAETEDIQVSVDPSDYRVSFYQSQEDEVVADVTSNVGYRLVWTINPMLTHLHYQEIGKDRIRLWASGLIAPDSTNEGVEDGHQAIRLEVYSQTGRLVTDLRFEVTVYYPIRVALPRSVYAHFEPISRPQTPIYPEVNWENKVVFGPDPSSGYPQTPPDGMSFTWTAENGDVLSHEPVYQIAYDDFGKYVIQLEVSYQGFSGTSSVSINH